MVPASMARAMWRQQWIGESVLVFTDNAAVVAIINSGCSKDPQAMHLMRCLFFFLAQYKCTLRATHIQGCRNIAADALSRNNLNIFRQQVPTAKRLPSPLQPELVKLLVHRVEEAIRIYFAKGLADSTQRTYRSGKERYLKFCNQLGSKPLPLNERTLCAFVSHLALEGLKHKSIKVYLSAIRHLQIAEGLPDPYQGTLPRLEYVLKGIKRTQAEEGKGSRERLPITMEIMRKLKQVWDK